MKLDLILLFAILWQSTVLAQEEKNREYVKYNDNITCREDLFTLYDTHNSNNTRKPKLFSSEVLDCFGIGRKFAHVLDWFLKINSNGTSALKVKFHAISRNKSEKITIQHGSEIDVNDLDIDVRKRTILIVHGFLATGEEKWIADMTKAFLKWDNVNVFVVDWSEGSNTWNYYKAAINTRTVGDQIATFFGKLIEAVTQSQEVDENAWGPLHFIGHSLGAHISGYAAKEIKRRQSQWRVQRITGLDPAQPCFKNSDKKLRLDNTDAPFVDVIHTNGRLLSKLGLGMPDPIGHVDFYPNGGKVQPGCALSQSIIWRFLPMPIQKISQTICSHGRSYLYFIDSIISEIRNSCSFWSPKWDLSYNNIDAILNSDCKSKNCIEMGINAEKYRDRYNGTFFTVTGKSKPFCRVDESAKGEVKYIMEKVKRKLNCDSNEVFYDKQQNETLVVYD